MKKIGIYKITSPSNRIYIGQSIDIEKRFYLYSIHSCSKQKRLYNSLLKHGFSNHKIEILELCDVLKLNERERYYQEFYDVLSKNGLNCVYQCTNEKKRVISQEMKSKISLKNKGLNNGMYGIKHTEEFKQNRRNHKHTQESILKIQERSKGGNNPNAKIVLDLSTGIFYDCVGDASVILGMKRDCLKQKLNGKRKNNTNYIYA